MFPASKHQAGKTDMKSLPDSSTALKMETRTELRFSSPASLHELRDYLFDCY